MKNRIKFALALLSLCALTACSNTLEGIEKDTNDMSDWAHNKPSDLEGSLGPAPTGYGAKPIRQETTIKTAPAPEAVEENYLAPVESRQLPKPADRSSSAHDREPVWHQISGYNASHPSLPSSSQPLSSGSAAAAPVVVKYSPSVDVYPVNADTEPYTQLATNGGISPVGGELAQQVFFPYGSASISSIDRRNLRELAQSLVNNGAQYRLNVVGHASKHVNNVRDPFKRQMINFKMAQRRADAVERTLINAGASPEWVVATSAGDSQPNPRRHGKSQEEADRRAEVYVND